MTYSPNQTSPPSVTKRYNGWEWRRKQSTVVRLGLAAGAFIAAGIAGLSATTRTGAIASVVAAFCAAAIAAVRPSAEYLKFSRAWRALDDAKLRYEAGLITLEELFDAVARGEAIIAAADDEIYQPKG